ncbi:GIY-YIG catalytic domain-containing protein [Astrocystis sublimbata]|nr:GIY-YIG catalytic domain-containing protein [Astrocystis sublimbata]
MAVHSKPIPPLYTVYILRSTVRNASLYIGSTPNPPRRLKQHNGVVQGGAARTSRQHLRPWEMVALVSGFPGMVAALKFEWALNNPHLSLHIPTEARISIATKRKRNGHPRRPPHNIKSIVSNVHLLLNVPSFRRWPLRLHFFDAEVHRAWTRCCDTAAETVGREVPVFTDFAPEKSTTAATTKAARGRRRRASATTAASAADGGDVGDQEGTPTDPEPPKPRGIHALPLDYAPMKSYVEKTQSLYTFEREGVCVVCDQHLPHEEGLYATCSNPGCEGTGHLNCWSKHLLDGNDTEDIIPISGRCPKCEGEVVWGDMMKEMSLRLRGSKEVEDLLREKRRRRKKDAVIEDSHSPSPSPSP